MYVWVCMSSALLSDLSVWEVSSKGEKVGEGMKWEKEAGRGLGVEKEKDEKG